MRQQSSLTRAGTMARSEKKRSGLAIRSWPPWCSVGIFAGRGLVLADRRGGRPAARGPLPRRGPHDCIFEPRFVIFGRESSGRGNSGPPVCQIPQAQLGSQNLFAGEGLPARLSPTMTDIPDSLTRKRSLVQIQTAHHAKSQVSPHVIQLSQPYASRRPTFPRVPAPRPIELRVPVRTLSNRTL
jgi:hypothetical protein